MTARDYIDGVSGGDRVMLARAITLVESNAPRHAAIAEEVVQELLLRATQSIRVGISGAPGVGKSSLIEALGILLCRLGKKVSVLAVDPSSSISKGAILGDKTRMETLAREPNCFIRPSPARDATGGVTHKTREAIVLCEAAGFEVILVETVGVGQSETAVRSMVDFFLVLMLAGAGDELQGIKRGILELADALVITKADGDNAKRAESARSEYARALHCFAPVTPDWHPQVLTCSSREGVGIREVWELIERFHHSSLNSGFITQRRRGQLLDWMRQVLEQEVWREFWSHSAVMHEKAEMERALLDGNIMPAAGARRILRAHRDSLCRQQD